MRWICSEHGRAAGTVRRSAALFRAVLSFGFHPLCGADDLCYNAACGCCAAPCASAVEQAWRARRFFMTKTTKAGEKARGKSTKVVASEPDHAGNHLHPGVAGHAGAAAADGCAVCGFGHGGADGRGGVRGGGAYHAGQLAGQFAHVRHGRGLPGMYLPRLGRQGSGQGPHCGHAVRVRRAHPGYARRSCDRRGQSLPARLAQCQRGD